MLLQFFYAVNRGKRELQKNCRFFSPEKSKCSPLFPVPLLSRLDKSIFRK